MSGILVRGGRTPGDRGISMPDHVLTRTKDPALHGLAALIQIWSCEIQNGHAKSKDVPHQPKNGRVLAGRATTLFRSHANLPLRMTTYRTAHAWQCAPRQACISDLQN